MSFLIYPPYSIFFIQMLSNANAIDFDCVYIFSFVQINVKIVYILHENMYNWNE